MKTKIYAIVIIMILNSLLCGCFRKEENVDYTTVRMDGRTGYRETICDIPIDNNSEYNVFRYIRTVLKKDDSLYVVVTNSDYNTGTTINTMLYELSEDGELISSYEIGTNNASCYALVGDKIACLSDTDTKFWSLEEHTVTKTVEADQRPITANSYKGGYVACYPGSVVQYDSEGNEIGRIDNQEFSYFSVYCDSIYEKDGKTILVACPGIEYRYYEIDFDSDYCSYLGNNSDFDIGLQFCCGNYIFDSVGEYSFDAFTGEKTLLAEWNNINSRPGGRNANGYRFYYPFGDDLFVEAYVDANNTACIQIYHYDNTIDYSNSKIITVGGTGMNFEIPLRMAAYIYNCSQDEYRVVISEYEDYGITNEENVEANARLISEFQSGNTPDIFWGNIFDYEYFGRNDLVIDMLPYLENNENFDVSDIQDSFWNIMCRDGHCYQLFDSYYFNGFWGKTSLLGNMTDMDYHEFYSLENEEGDVFGPFYCNDLAGIALNDSFRDFVDGDRLLITQDDLSDIVDYSLSIGYPRSTPFESMFSVGFEMLRNNEYLLSHNTIVGLLSYDYSVEAAGELLSYIGSPSINGSAHKICPHGNVAVSSNTPYPEACVDFLTYLFSDEVQRYMISIGYPSVRESVNEEFYSYAASPESIPEDQIMYRKLFYNVDPISEDVIAAYRECVDSIDMLAIYDWSVSQIITEELDTNDLQGKPADEIAESLYSRLNVYVSDYYG